MLKILYNGNSIEVKKACSLAEILAKLADQTVPFAVAVNGTIIARNQYQSFILNEADEIEVVTPMQGG